MKEFPAGVAEKLGFYVYFYADPRDGRIFYVGKGQGNRTFAHLSEAGGAPKHRVLRELEQAEISPCIEILMHGLDEASALLIETAAIDLLGMGQTALTNRVRGHGSGLFGRMTVEEIAAHYAPDEVVFEPNDHVLLIRVNQLFRPGMSPVELYEITRGVWVLGERRQGVQFALAVFQGIVHEVYAIESWHPAGSTNYVTREAEDVEGRVEFVGRVAPPGVRAKYLHRSVRERFGRGVQSPTIYVNC